MRTLVATCLGLALASCQCGGNPGSALQDSGVPDAGSGLPADAGHFDAGDRLEDAGARPDGGLSDGGEIATCTNGSACDFPGGNGICTAMACANCIDDAGCSTAYDPTYACVGGACAVPMNGCSTDDDCASGFLCELGMCTSATAICTAKAEGDLCAPLQTRHCCNRSGALTCLAVTCCTDAQCGANETCTNGGCVTKASNCGTVSNGLYTLDPAFTGAVSTGTTLCPFKTVHETFEAIRSSTFTGDFEVIVLPGTITVAAEGGASHFPHAVPGGTFVHTPDGMAPAKLYGPDASSLFSITLVSTTRSVQLRNLELVRATTGTTGAGEHVTAGTAAFPAKLNHLEIHGFDNGITIDSGAVAVLNAGVNAHDNDGAGLHLIASTASVVVPGTADARTHFDSNQYGILASADVATSLTLNGAVMQGTGFKSITASSNRQNGLRVGGRIGNLIDNVGVVNNAASGMAFYAGASYHVQNCNIAGSGGSGVYMLPADPGQNAMGTVVDLGGQGTLDGSVGHNTFSNSHDVHLCTVNGNVSSGFAEQNIFDNADCSVPGSATPVTSYSTCANHGGGVATDFLITWCT